MKPVSISDSSYVEQIWNSAPQLANIPVIGTQSLLPPVPAPWWSPHIPATK